MCVSKKIYIRVVNASRKAKGGAIVLSGVVSFCSRKSWQSDGRQSMGKGIGRIGLKARNFAYE
jgi:hypothetical protein